MNIKPSAYTILCYGDSNTWGYTPGTEARYPIDVRWTGLLQKKLGDEYEVIEEGVNGRTTNLDEEREGKNGATYLRPCLQTHSPLDLVILMLGTNDMKEQFSQTPENIAENISKLITIIKNPDFNFGHEPKIIVITPPLINEKISGVKDKYLGAEEKSRQIVPLYIKVAETFHTGFIDSQQIISPSDIDGYHLDPVAHELLADSLYKKIKQLSQT